MRAVTFAVTRRVRLKNIMPYNTTGGSHRDGVSNEKKIVDFLNATNGGSLRLNELFGESLQFVQIGGTKSVSDMDIFREESGERVCGVSIKNHKQGSYDYVNTSRTRDYLPEESVNRISSGIQGIRTAYLDQEEKIEAARAAKNTLLEAEFVNLTSDAIKSLLQKINVRNPKLIIVNDVKDKKLKCYHESAFTELATEPYKEENVYSLKKGRGKTSRQILRNGVSTNLRVRIELNNGVKALLGGFGAGNKNSSVAIKVQQDSVDKVLAGTTLYSECDFQ